MNYKTWGFYLKGETNQKDFVFILFVKIFR